MSAACAILPFVWATAAEPEGMKRKPVAAVVAVAREDVAAAPVAPGMAFYRKYTEGILRRYLRLSLEAGRTPSLLGREMFRGKVTSYRVHSFEDVVIFVHDVEKCLAKLDAGQQQIIHRIALQEYTQDELASMTGLPQRTLGRRYAGALDRLTAIFLRVKLLQPMKECQGAGGEEIPASSSFYCV